MGDPLSSELQGHSSDFVLNRQSLLRNDYLSSCIEMIYRNKVTQSADGKYLTVKGLAFSLTGETIYMIVSSAVSINRIMAFEVSNWKLKAQKRYIGLGVFVNDDHLLAVLRGGVLIATSHARS